MEMFLEVNTLKFAELTLLSWIFMEYEMLYTETMNLVNVISKNREGNVE
jgi:hypothetical protein